MLKEETLMVMNSNERKMEAILIKREFPRSKARCMIFMLVMAEGTSKQIEYAMDLRQPEVSVSMKELVDEGIIKIVIVHAEKKGRPVHIYKLAKTKAAIIADMERKMNRDVERTVRNIAKLKKILIK